MKRKSSFSIETEAGIREVNEQLMDYIIQFALPFLESIVSMRDIRLALEKNYRPGKHNGMNWNEVLGLALAAAESGDASFARSVLEDYRSGKNCNDTFAARVEAHIEK